MSDGKDNGLRLRRTTSVTAGGKSIVFPEANDIKADPNAAVTNVIALLPGVFSRNNKIERACRSYVSARLRNLQVNFHLFMQRLEKKVVIKPSFVIKFS